MLRSLGRCTALVKHPGPAGTPEVAGRASGTEHSVPRRYTSLAAGILRTVVSTPLGPCLKRPSATGRKVRLGGSAAATTRPGWPLPRQVTARGRRSRQGACQRFELVKVRVG